MTSTDGEELRKAIAFLQEVRKNAPLYERVQREIFTVGALQEFAHEQGVIVSEPVLVQALAHDLKFRWAFAQQKHQAKGGRQTM